MNHHAGQIGGPGMTVEIDESTFGKTKFNRGRYIEWQWVFGGICRQRDKDTLLPIIRAHILPGTCVMSDMWKAYDSLKDEGYTHHWKKYQISKLDLTWVLLVFLLDFQLNPNLVKMQNIQFWIASWISFKPKLENDRNHTRKRDNPNSQYCVH